MASQLVFEEARRNLKDKAPEVVADFDNLCDAVGFEIVRPTKGEVEEALEYNRRQGCTYRHCSKKGSGRLSGEFRSIHLVDAPEVAKRSGLKILLPSELEKIRKQPANE